MADSAQIVRDAYAAFARRDVPTMMAQLADDVDWSVPDVVPQGGHFAGKEGVGRFLGGLAEHWPEVALQIDDVIADAEHVVGIGRARGRLRGGEQASYGFAHVFTVRDGRIVRFREYVDPDATPLSHRTQRP